MPRIAILTGAELRHTFMRKALSLASGIKVLRSYCEGAERSLRSRVESQASGPTPVELFHVASRERSEQDFFGLFVALTEDRSHPVFIRKGAVNDPSVYEDICSLNPDVLVAYGCSIIRDPLMGHFTGKILNVHLGLSPYYRGSGTNFWALVNGEPEFVGATFMYMDAGIDTGEIIHQIRARVFPGDTPHQIGNRLIADVARVYPEVIRRFGSLPRMPQPLPPPDAKTYKRRDANGSATARLYEQFAAGAVHRYLDNRERRVAAAPIVENPEISRAVGDL